MRKYQGAKKGEVPKSDMAMPEDAIILTFEGKGKGHGGGKWTPEEISSTPSVSNGTPVKEMSPGALTLINQMALLN